MSTLVAYASKHGATQETVERIANTLNEAGQEAKPRPVGTVGDRSNEDVRAPKEEITMAYLKPPAFTRRLANPLAKRLNARGVATLTVVGRRTGKPHKVPVIPVEVGETRYLVSPYGESEWVRNLRAAGKGELSRKGRTETFEAVEVPIDQRGPVIGRYREVAGRVVSQCFTKLPDAGDHPVFEVEQSSPGR